MPLSRQNCDTTQSYAHMMRERVVCMLYEKHLARLLGHAKVQADYWERDEVSYNVHDLIEVLGVGKRQAYRIMSSIANESFARRVTTDFGTLIMLCPHRVTIDDVALLHIHLESARAARARLMGTYGVGHVMYDRKLADQVMSYAIMGCRVGVHEWAIASRVDTHEFMITRRLEGMEPYEESTYRTLSEMLSAMRAIAHDHHWGVMNEDE